MNINKLLKDFPKLLERMDHLERTLLGLSDNRFPTTVDTGTQVPVTLAPAVSERSPTVNEGVSIGEERVRNKRGSTRRN
jgi:hypothetical protein